MNQTVLLAWSLESKGKDRYLSNNHAHTHTHTLLKSNNCLYLATFNSEIAFLFMVLQFYSICIYPQTIQNTEPCS